MLNAFFAATLTIFAPPSGPPIVCEISMTNWCIVQLPSTIEMKDAGKSREWNIATNPDTVTAQVRISEDKFCGGELRYRPDADPATFRFEAPGEHCGLTLSVSSQGPDVRPEALVRMLIMLKHHDHWEPARF